MYQELLLREIRRKTGSKSLNDEIANILNISYDAAHRRTSAKSKFTLEECVQLTQHYNISFDSLYLEGNQILASKTKPIRKAEDLLNYFETSMALLQDFEQMKGTKIYYSAKDIPFFYTVSENVLSKFKLYVWMNLLNHEDYFIKFEDFETGPGYGRKSENLRNLYEKSEVIEIWNDTTISSILYQIKFYFEIGFLTQETASVILEELKSLLHYIENKTENGSGKFQLYSHEILILNNSILFSNPEKSALFIPYNMFGYLMTDDGKTCEDSLNFFQHQIKNSKSLNFTGTRDRKLFFNKMLLRIEDLKKKLLNF